MTFKIVEPRVLPRSLSDGLVSLLCGLLQAAILFFLPSSIVALISGSFVVFFSSFFALYMVFILFTVKYLKVSEGGIEFVRQLGSPRYLSWSEIQSVSPVSARELILKGWLWPIFPAREMTITQTTIGHYRISYESGFIYFPPRDTTEFEALIPDSIMPRSSARPNEVISIPENVSVGDSSATSQTSPEEARRSAGRSHLLSSTMANLLACGIAGLFAAVALDGGMLFQFWYFAMAAYWSAMLMIWLFHRNDLSKLDLIFARWGFLMSFFTAPFLASLFWGLYGSRAPLRDWFFSLAEPIHRLAPLMDASSRLLT